MSEKTAEIVSQKMQVIRSKCMEIEQLASLIRSKFILGTDIIQFSEEDKTKLITHYQTMKAELEKLVSELP